MFQCSFGKFGVCNAFVNVLPGMPSCGKLQFVGFLGYLNDPQITRMNVLYMVLMQLNQASEFWHNTIRETLNTGQICFMKLNRKLL